MKNTNRVLILVLLTIILVGCSQVIERADRTITMAQETMTGIVNDLTNIQSLEQSLQSDFETTLQAGEDLQAFADSEQTIYKNVDQRISHLEELSQRAEKLTELSKELEAQAKQEEMPTDDITNISQLINELKTALNTYIEDYKTNIATEKASYQAIASSNIDYAGFFKVLDNVGVTFTNNYMNLEKVLGYFEPINTRLINFKVYLAKLIETK